MFHTKKMPQNQPFDEWQRETYRKSNDTILVFNPTDEDYVCYFDKFPNVVPNKNKDMGFGKGKMQLIRYIGEKYMKEMKDKLINAEADHLLEKAKKDREARGLSVDPYEVNAQVVNVAPRTNSDKEIEKIYGILYCGLVKEFGLYDQPVKEEILQVDQRTPEERIMDKVTSLPKANNSEVVEPDDLTESPKNEDFTAGGTPIVHTSNTQPEKPRRSRISQ